MFNSKTKTLKVISLVIACVLFITGTVLIVCLSSNKKANTDISNNESCTVSEDTSVSFENISETIDNETITNEEQTSITEVEGNTSNDETEKNSTIESSKKVTEGKTTEKETEKVNAPKPTNPKPSTPQTTTPKPTSPQTTKPSSKPTTPKPTTPETTTSSPQVSVVTSSDLAKIKSGFMRLVNEERARVGVQPLSTNSTLTNAANTRSREILNNFSHTRPNGSPFYTVIDENAYSQYGTGENIQLTSHMGSKPFTKKDLFVGKDDQIVAAYTTMFNNFKNSSGHYANMINGDFCDTGIGISYKIDSASGMAIFYVCQIFGSGS